MIVIYHIRGKMTEDGGIIFLNHEGILGNQEGMIT